VNGIGRPLAASFGCVARQARTVAAIKAPTRLCILAFEDADQRGSIVNEIGISGLGDDRHGGAIPD